MAKADITPRERQLKDALRRIKRSKTGEVWHPTLCARMKVAKDGKADRALYTAMLADPRFIRTESTKAVFAAAPEGE